MTDLNSRTKNITSIATFLIQITLCLTIIIGETLVLSDYKKRADILIAIIIIPLIIGLFIKLKKNKSNKLKEIGIGLVKGSFQSIALFLMFYMLFLIKKYR